MPETNSGKCKDNETPEGWCKPSLEYLSLNLLREVCFISMFQCFLKDFRFQFPFLNWHQAQGETVNNPS